MLDRVNVTEAEVNAIEVSSFDAFLKAFQAQQEPILQRSKKILDEIEADLGIKLPDNFARDTFAYHLNFIRNNKAGYEAFLKAQRNKKPELLKKAREGELARTKWHPETDSAREKGAIRSKTDETEFDVFASSTTDAMLKEYLTLFFWPHFRMTALLNHYDAQAISAGAISKEDLDANKSNMREKIENATALKLGKKPLLPGLFKGKPQGWDRYRTITEKVFQSTIWPVYDTHTLTNSLLFFLEGDLGYPKARMLAYDPRYPIIGRYYHSDGKHDFDHDHGRDLLDDEDKGFVILNRFDPKGSRESYEIALNTKLKFAKFGISEQDAKQLTDYFNPTQKPENELSEDAKESIDAVKTAQEATRTIKNLVLKLRAGVPITEKELGAANSDLQFVARALISRLQQVKVSSEEDKKKLPPTLLGHYLDHGIYKSSYAANLQYWHLLNEVREIISSQTHQR